MRKWYKYIAEAAMAKPAKLKKDQKILDVGCGVGILVKQFNLLGYNAIGIDISEIAIGASIDPANCKLVPKSSKLDFEDNHFDLVVSKEVLEHIPIEEIDACIFEWDRVSKGKMIHLIAVQERGKTAIDDPTHVNVQTENWWINKFKQFNYSATKNPYKHFIYPYGSKGYLMFIKD